MNRHRVSILALAGSLAILGACGSGGSSSDTTTGIRFKNAALPTTTAVDSGSTTVAPGSSTVAPATTLAGATTTAVPVVVEKPNVVTDPGNYAPTYLAPTDSNGSPRVSLTSEANPAVNTAKAVSTALKTDSSGNVQVTAAEWMGTGPLSLVWTVRTKTGTVTCENCAFLAPHARRTLAVLLASDASSAIASIVGVRNTAIGIGDFIGNGWAFEAIVKAKDSTEETTSGTTIRNWVLACSGSTADTCNSTKYGIADMQWQNKYWSVSDCKSALQNGGPRRLVGDLSARLAAATTADAKARIRAAAYMDRVLVALPIYKPMYTGTGAARTLTGYASTGCAA